MLSQHVLNETNHRDMRYIMSRVVAIGSRVFEKPVTLVGQGSYQDNIYPDFSKTHCKTHFGWSLVMRLLYNGQNGMSAIQDVFRRNRATERCT